MRLVIPLLFICGAALAAAPKPAKEPPKPVNAPAVLPGGPGTIAPIILIVPEVGEYRRTDDQTLAEHDALTVMWVSMIISAFDRQPRDVIGYIHQHRLERFFVVPSFGPTPPPGAEREPPKMPPVEVPKTAPVTPPEEKKP